MNAAAILVNFVPNLKATLRVGLPRWFLLSAGAILTLAGTGNLLESLDQSSIFNLPDPVFGFQFRHLLLFAGLADLLAAFLCLFTNRRFLCLGLIVWLMANFVVYRVGLSTMGWDHPYPWLAGLMKEWGISPLMADGITAAALAYLLLGSMTALWLGRQPTPSPQPVVAKPGAVKAGQPVFIRTLKISCTVCGGHIEFPTNFFGERIPCPHCQATITLQKARNLKMSCTACVGHIEFPDYAIGENISCPHCKTNITLKEPA